MCDEQFMSARLSAPVTFVHYILVPLFINNSKVLQALINVSYCYDELKQNV